MLDTWVHDVQLVQPGSGVVPANLLISGGKVASIDPVAAPAPPGARCVEGAGRTLTPGLIDLHAHGIGTALFERSPEDICTAARILPRFGVTCVLPTLYRAVNRASFKQLEELAGAIAGIRSVRMPGFHLEGPFLALAGAGAQTVPGDLTLLKEILAACRGRVTAMSISPDTPDILPVIEHLVERGIVPFITHTGATAEQTQAAIDAGAAHATHFYDVFPVPPQTEPGVRPVGAVEAILADPRASVDFIADGVHVSPFAIRAALAAKTYRGIALITDSMIGAGMPPGDYDTTWGFSIRVRPNDAARSATVGDPYYGLLSGSVLTMDRGIRNLMAWLKLPAHEVWAMGTSNPARIARLHELGRIQVGAAADLVLWDHSLHPAITWVDGVIVFDAAAERPEKRVSG